MLSEMLSQLLIAYTIEFDNEIEHRLPSRTSTFGASEAGQAASSAGQAVPRPWLCSMAFWSNFLRYVTADGLRLEVAQALPANFGGLERWGYIRVEGVKGDRLVKPTRGGRRARSAWGELAGVIDRRWEQRFGARAVGELRGALSEIAAPVRAGMPLYLPMVGFGDGMRTSYRDLRELGLPEPALEELDLAGLLSAVLLAFTLDYEERAKVPLPISANALRVTPDEGVRLGEIPLLAGVSKEGVASSAGFLERHGYVAVEPDPSGRRGKIVRPTARGIRARDGRPLLGRAVEGAWRDRFGSPPVDRLIGAAGELMTSRTGGRATLALGLEPYPECWRARGGYRAQTRAVLDDPARALARHPMVLHRGGYPDGS